MVKVYLKDGSLCQYDGITAESVKFNEELGVLRINGPDEIILIPWDNIRFVQAERSRNE